MDLEKLADIYGFEEIYEVEIEGVRPLLLNPPLPEKLKERKRTGETEDPEEEARKKLYRDPKTKKIAIPARLIKAAIREAAKDYKVPGKGRTTFKDYVRAGIIIEPQFIEIDCNGKDPEEAWQVDIQPGVLPSNKAMVLIARPRFDEWKLRFRIKVIDPTIKDEDLMKFLVTAGMYKGIGSYRPDYGLFKVTKFEKVKSNTGKKSIEE